MLEVDDDSRLGSEILLGGKRYGAPDVPSDDQIANFAGMRPSRQARCLKPHAIHRYEISNFARPGAESLHNLKYWKRAPYIGFGADAHSFDGAKRRQNVQSVQDYVVRSERGESAYDPKELPHARLRSKKNSSWACGFPRACMPTNRTGSASDRSTSQHFLDAGVLELLQRQSTPDATRRNGVE